MIEKLRFQAFLRETQFFIKQTLLLGFQHEKRMIVPLSKFGPIDFSGLALSGRPVSQGNSMNGPGNLPVKKKFTISAFDFHLVKA